jgi:AraC-like DNA-binding protein
VDFLLIGSLAINAFCTGLLLARHPKQAADWLLMSWLVLVGINLGALVVVERQAALGRFAGLLWLSALTPLLHGPVLWLYTRSLIRPGFRIRPNEAAHGIPFLCLTLILASAPGSRSGQWTYGLAGVGLSSVAGYGLAILRLLSQHTRNTEQLFSCTRGMQLRWLRHLVWLVLAVGLITVVSQGLVIWTHWPIGHFGNWYSNALLSGGFLLLAFYGVQQQTIYHAALPAEDYPPLVSVESASLVPKYARSGLEAGQLGSLFGQLRRHMEAGQAYRDPALSLSALAKQLGLPTHHVSQVINQEGGQTFFDFINQYRVQAVVRALQAREHRQKTLLGIALESGFNSKASFNRAFKKFSGLTPQAYVGRLRQEEQTQKELSRGHPTG